MSYFGHRVMWLVLLSILAGCGDSSQLPPIAAVSGVVTYKGKPIPSANVLFAPETSGPMAVGTTNADGQFTLVTQGQPGAVLGSHRVVIQAVVPKGGAQAQTVDPVTGREIVVEQVSLIPEKYGDMNRSGVTAVVEKKKNEFRFDLE